MKILHVNTYDSGGAAIAAIRLHKALLAQGIDSSILFLNKTNNNIPSSYYYIDECKKNQGFVMRQLMRLKNLLYSRWSSRHRNRLKLQNRADGFEMFSFNPADYDITTLRLYQDADIIHFHWISGFFDYSTFKKINKPVIWTLHDMNPFTGGCHYSIGCEKYKSECRNCPQLKGTISPDNSLVDQNYKKKFLSMVSPVITAPSVWLNSCSSQSTLFKNFQNVHIPYSLDTSTFKRLDKSFSRLVLNLPPGKKILLFVSDSIENKRKGFDLLLNALTHINHSDIHICAVGDFGKREEYPCELTFISRISDERLMSIVYSAADVFILPSREDNLPNVMLESLACGTPVIAFPVGGITDVINTGFNGILADDVTSSGLANALNDFLEGKYKFDSAEISNNAKQKFSPSVQSERYIALYQKTLNSHQNAV